ncbi:RDD family protein [Legionella israelensis]|uniref:RDD family protein n=1 Tax=Legionella israelensis TaxID=454 RepID=UPI00117DA80D|nr:RDD family protein [Legionella israelensis]QDP73519.1 RDD family protein [Legionella israelensis]
MFYIKYICAQCYDFFIAVTLVLTFTGFCLALRQGKVIPPHSLWYQLSLILIFYSYYYYSVKYGGQTLGMRAWRIRLISCKSGPLTAVQVTLRLVLYWPVLFVAPFCRKTPASLLRSWSKTTLILI